MILFGVREIRERAVKAMLPCKCERYREGCHKACRVFKEIMKRNDAERKRIKSARCKQIDEDVFFAAIKRRVSAINRQKRKSASQHRNAG